MSVPQGLLTKSLLAVFHDEKGIPCPGGMEDKNVVTFQ